MSQKNKTGAIQKIFSDKNPLFRLINNIGSLFEENGKWSSMRFASLFATILPLTVWAYVSMKTLAIATFPESIALIVVGSLGSKWLQKRDEIKGFRDSMMDMKSLKYDPIVPGSYNPNAQQSQPGNQSIYQSTYQTSYTPATQNSYQPPTNSYYAPVANQYPMNTGAPVTVTTQQQTSLVDVDMPNIHNMISQDTSNDIHSNNLDPSIQNNPSRKPRIY